MSPRFRVWAANFSLGRRKFVSGVTPRWLDGMKFRTFLYVNVVAWSTFLAAQTAAPTSPAPEVSYPAGYRQWMHITSVVNPAKKNEADTPSNETKAAAPHGLIHHLYANNLALEGYRTGHFPEGAVLIADWFALEEARSGLVQGARQSVDVMIRDIRYATTGGWGFEKFDQDSRTKRKVSSNAVKSCFECHQRAGPEREFVFSTLKP
jgi:Cytochrome P460